MRVSTMFIVALALGSVAFANDGNLDSKAKPASTLNTAFSLQTEPVPEYSGLGALTVFGKEVRKGVSTEVNEIDFTKVKWLAFLGKPTANLWGVTGQDGQPLVGGGLAWKFITAKDASFRASFTVGGSFAMAMNKVSDFEPGVGIQVNWKID